MPIVEIVPTETVKLACGCERTQITSKPAVGYVRISCLAHARPCLICKVALLREDIVCDPCMAETGRPLRFQRALAMP